MPTRNLQDLLEQTPSRQLFALLAMHHFAITSSRPKAELVERLYQHLTQPSIVQLMIAQLDAVGKDALRALVAADGALPVHTFVQRFGPIRPLPALAQGRNHNGSPLAGAHLDHRNPLVFGVDLL